MSERKISLQEGLKVTHKKFGDGTITKFADSKMTIKFDKTGDEKNFSYPTVINVLTFPTLDETAVSTITADAAEIVRKERDAKANQLQKVLSSIAEAKSEEDTEGSTTPIVVRIPYWFHAVCSEEQEAYNKSQRGLLCKRVPSCAVSCPILHMINEEYLDVDSKYNFSQDQVVILVATASGEKKGAKGSRRLVVGTAMIEEAQKITTLPDGTNILYADKSEDYDKRKVKKVTRLQFYHHSLVYLTEDEASEIPLKQAYVGKGNFSTQREITLEAAHEILATMRDEIEVSDPRHTHLENARVEIEARLLEARQSVLEDLRNSSDDTDSEDDDYDF